jgi:hypothetical protein
MCVGMPIPLHSRLDFIESAFSRATYVRVCPTQRQGGLFSFRILRIDKAGALHPCTSSMPVLCFTRGGASMRVVRFVRSVSWCIPPFYVRRISERIDTATTQRGGKGRRVPVRIEAAKCAAIGGDLQNDATSVDS